MVADMPLLDLLQMQPLLAALMHLPLLLLLLLAALMHQGLLLSFRLHLKALLSAAGAPAWQGPSTSTL